MAVGYTHGGLVIHGGSVILMAVRLYSWRFGYTHGGSVILIIYFIYLTDRCLFLSCSVMMGGGGVEGFVMNSEGISGGGRRGGTAPL